MVLVVISTLTLVKVFGCLFRGLKVRSFWLLSELEECQPSPVVSDCKGVVACLLKRRTLDTGSPKADTGILQKGPWLRCRLA
eukprot:681303-Amphidinium_carterae.1